MDTSTKLATLALEEEVLTEYIFKHVKFICEIGKPSLTNISTVWTLLC